MFIKFGRIVCSNRKENTAIITAKESVASNLEYHNKEGDGESLHQNVVIFLTKSKNIKIKDTFQKNTTNTPSQ